VHHQQTQAGVVGGDALQRHGRLVELHGPTRY
jgi:hypothetical protein